MEFDLRRQRAVFIDFLFGGRGCWGFGGPHVNVTLSQPIRVVDGGAPLELFPFFFFFIEVSQGTIVKLRHWSIYMVDCR